MTRADNALLRVARERNARILRRAACDWMIGAILGATLGASLALYLSR